MVCDNLLYGRYFEELMWHLFLFGGRGRCRILLVVVLRIDIARPLLLREKGRCRILLVCIINDALPVLFQDVLRTNLYLSATWRCE